MGKVKLEPKAGPLPLLGFYPTIMIGVNVDGRPDFTTVAWTGTFSINLPSIDLVKETDYCGLASGSRVDKSEDCRFTVFYGKLKTVPLIEQCPINHTCEVVQILNLGSHELIVGRIVESYASENCLVDGRPDPARVKPFLFAGFGYYAVGEYLGKAFH